MQKTIIFLLTLTALSFAQIRVDISAPRYEGVDHKGASGVYSVAADLDKFAVEFGLARLDIGAVQSTAAANVKISIPIKQGKYLLNYFVYLPMSGYRNSARLYGLAASPENIGAYSYALSGGATVTREFKFQKLGYKKAENDLTVSLCAGLQPLLTFKKSTLSNNFGIFIPYAFGLTDYRGHLVIGGELAGNYILTQTDRNFSDNIFSQFKIFTGWQFGKFTTAAYIKFPCDKTTDRLLRNTLGLSVSYK